MRVQYVEHWESLPVALRQGVYGKAVASLRSIYDTHPSYQDRWRALQQLEDAGPPERDARPAILLLPQAAELGRGLTLQLLRR